ncbi:hypothetical protein SAMN05444354_114127 [Stigmatella aurantiaca]|uniref:Lipoprotein n=1 Tax=Stigmatella aurantiaca TaxID=41 RepID=A0A1H7X6W9_STIAU|nr:hypothetical protein [Stigmatella aurantiaca]SEM29570.1 hypothetical protein SAMN05444354_114127 [Stigmatella aurantiaca]
MRITSFVAVLVAGLTFAGTGCGSTQPAPTEEQAAAEQVSTDGTHSEQAICKLMWTCDWSGYYSTQAQCTAACGSNTCYRDYACNGTCVCP